MENFLLQPPTIPLITSEPTALRITSEPGVEIVLDEEVKPEVVVQDGKILTSSRNVAGVFLKPHYDVLKAINTLDCSDEFREGNFSLSSYTTVQNRPQPEYLMTFDGFTFLAMGFTGKRAAQFKEAYIKEFNRMREALSLKAFSVNCLKCFA